MTFSHIRLRSTHMEIRGMMLSLSRLPNLCLVFIFEIPSLSPKTQQNKKKKKLSSIKKYY